MGLSAERADRSMGPAEDGRARPSGEAGMARANKGWSRGRLSVLAVGVTGVAALAMLVFAGRADAASAAAAALVLVAIAAAAAWIAGRQPHAHGDTAASDDSPGEMSFELLL